MLSKIPMPTPSTTTSFTPPDPNFGSVSRNNTSLAKVFYPLTGALVHRLEIKPATLPEDSPALSSPPPQIRTSKHTQRESKHTTNQLEQCHRLHRRG
jgi:hypothetical protein